MCLREFCLALAFSVLLFVKREKHLYSVWSQYAFIFSSFWNKSALYIQTKPKPQRSVHKYFAAHIVHISIPSAPQDHHAVIVFKKTFLLYLVDITCQNVIRHSRHWATADGPFSAYNMMCSMASILTDCGEKTLN